MSDLIKRLGERIRQLRKEKNLSQEALGALAEIHTNYIGQVERGEKNLTIGTLEKLAEGLDISLEQLFRFLDPKPDKDEVDELIEMLSTRAREDKTMLLSLARTILSWEQQKRG